MKKIAAILIVVLFSAGCTKDEPICWICDLTNLPPTQAQHPDFIEVCNDSEHPPTTYEDGQGNTWGGFPCEKK